MERSGPFAAISDDELLCRLSELVRQSRRLESELVAHIGEVDERRLYTREACSSMFVYCTEVLHLSEAEAYLRISVARASREHPLLLTLLADGRLHLSGIAKLAPHLTPENRDALIGRATHRSKRQIEELVAELNPRLDLPTLVRKFPERSAPSPISPLGRERRSGAVEASRTELHADRVEAVSLGLHPDGAESTTPELRPDAVEVSQRSTSATPSPGDVRSAPAGTVEPLGNACYRVHFTASAELYQKLERLRALLRPEAPDGDLAAIIERAVTEKLERIEARRFAKTARPRKALSQTSTAAASRHLPAAVRRAVRERDGDRCGYVDQSGRRCSERARLEFHHRHPFGLGGDHSPDNVRLMCHAHNTYLAEQDYGRRAMVRFRRTAIRPSPRGS